ncbi:hypothetical protein CGCF413_v012935 [Colletotrichum fructicola]|nr:hypothetical protein CGCF413_v012935 [Colletotrichum fructicola]
MESRDSEDENGRMDGENVSTDQEVSLATSKPASTSRDMERLTQEMARRTQEMARLTQEMARLTQDMARVRIHDGQEEMETQENARVTATRLRQSPKPATRSKSFDETFEDATDQYRQNDIDIPAAVTTPSGVHIPPNVRVAPGVKIPPGSKFPTDIPIVFPSGTTLPQDIPIGLAEDCLRRLNLNLSSWAPAPAVPTTDLAGEGQNTEIDKPSVKLSQTLTNTKPEGARDCIHTCNDDATTVKQDYLQYEPGEQLCLSPHEPPEPYGISGYPNPDNMSSNDKMLSEEEEHMSRTELVFRYRPYVPLAKRKNEFGVLLPTDSTHSDSNKGMKKSTSKSDKQAEDFQVIVEVVRLIYGGSEEGCQVLLCKATKVPQRGIWTTSPKNIDEPSLYGEPLTVGDLVVVKVFDPLFYGDVSNTDKGPWKVTSIADGDLSRENAAYRHLWEAGRTGSPHLAPQYHGSWTLQLGSDYPKFQVQVQTRRVGAIMIEYIQSKSIEDLCSRNKRYHLVPPTGPTYLDFEKTKQLDLTREVRLKTLKNFMKHTVNQLHAGVEHWWPEPENILISTDKEDKPRVVLIDYVSSMIDSKRKEPYGLFKDYVKPPHPYGQFSIEKLTHFAGWFPPGWRSEHFDTWVLRRFHSLENRDYTNPWTHKRGTDYQPDSDSETDSAETSKQKPDTLHDVPLEKS